MAFLPQRLVAPAPAAQQQQQRAVRAVAHKVDDLAALLHQEGLHEGYIRRVLEAVSPEVSPEVGPIKDDREIIFAGVHSLRDTKKWLTNQNAQNTEPIA